MVQQNDVVGEDVETVILGVAAHEHLLSDEGDEDRHQSTSFRRPKEVLASRESRPLCYLDVPYKKNHKILGSFQGRRGDVLLIEIKNEIDKNENLS